MSARRTAFWMMSLTAPGESRRVSALLPLLTGRNSGPASMPARSTQLCRRVTGLVFGVPDEPGARGTDGEIEARDVLAWVNTDPGRSSLNTMLTEIGKLEAIRLVGLPVGLLTEVAPKVVTGWRVRAAVLSPSHFRDAAPEVR